MFPPGGHELVPRVIRTVGIVHVVFGTPPEAGDHRVEQPALRRVGQHMLSESSLLGGRFLPQLLVPSRLCANPSTPIEAHEPLQHSLHGLPLAVLSRELGHGAHWDGCHRSNTGPEQGTTVWRPVGCEWKPARSHGLYKRWCACQNRGIGSGWRGCCCVLD